MLLAENLRNIRAEQLKRPHRVPSFEVHHALHLVRQWSGRTYRYMRTCGNFDTCIQKNLLRAHFRGLYDLYICLGGGPVFRFLRTFAKLRAQTGISRISLFWGSPLIFGRWWIDASRTNVVNDEPEQLRGRFPIDHHLRVT